MNLTWIILKILLIAEVIIESEGIPLINETIRKILIDQEIREVQFIIHGTRWNDEEITNEVYKTVTEGWPTNYIFVNDLIPHKLSPNVRVYSQTLILYVYISKYRPNSSNMSTMTEIVRSLLYDTCCPKILLLTILEKKTSFESLLKYMWSKRLLDVTILELLKDEQNMYDVTIHHYNPFSKIYTMQLYSEAENLQWFPNKLQNLHKYPLKVDVTNRMGHNSLKRDSQGYIIEHKGPDDRALRTLVKIMNFTAVLYPRKNEEIEFKERAYVDNLVKIRNDEIEMFITTLPYDLNTTYKYFGLIFPIGKERWCAVIPLTYQKDTFSFLKVERSILSVIIFLSFWILSIFMNFDRIIWQPLKLFGIMFSISMQRQPVRIVERFSLLCFLLISAIYSSDLYADLTMIKLISGTEVDYQSFKELYRSGLSLVFDKKMYDIIKNYGTFSSRDIIKKVRITKDILSCPDYMLNHKNVSCIMETNMATIFIYLTANNGKPRMKICNRVCYWEPPVGYMFHKYSPYIYMVSDIFQRIVESGLRGRWYLDYFEEYARKRKDSDEFEDINETLITIIFNKGFIHILLCGYTLSFITFLGEIIKSRTRRKNNKIMK